MTGTDVATTGGALALRPDQTQFSDTQIAALRHMGIPTQTTAADLQVFLHRAQVLRLDPFAGQIHLVDYGGKPTIQVGIHGWEAIARDAADEQGVTIEWEDVRWCGPDGVWRDVWLADEPPAAARVVLLRDGRRYPAVCLYREFVGMKKVYRDHKWTGEWAVNSMWESKPAHMLAKCVRAAALRSAFPRQFADVRIPEEVGERPATVRGEVVTQQPAGPGPLETALTLVDGASTRGELLAIWEQHAPRLTVTERARLQKACQQAAADLEQAQETTQQPPQATEDPIPDQNPSPRLEALTGVLEALGYVDPVDQVALCSRIVGDVASLADLTGTQVSTLIQALQPITGSPDPQTALDDLLTALETHP